MSHFVICAVVPESFVQLSDEVQKEQLAERLSPFNENADVQPYKKPCYCVGTVASREAMVANRTVARIDEMREKLWAESPEKKGESDEVGEARERRWKELIAPIVAEEKAALEAHPGKDKADPECDECHGSGVETTTRNPKSKWDWWCIGGRWTGMLAGIDPSKNPKNYQRCFLCHGSGQRNDDLGREARAQNPEYSCNGCSGTGREMKFPTDWVKEGNIASVASLLALDDKDFKRRAPFAFLDPSGVWLERGQMGMFGIAHDEKDKDAWVAEARAFLETQRGQWLVAVDCHI